MLDHDQLTPEETKEHNQPLIRDLQRYYTTRAKARDVAGTYPRTATRKERRGTARC